MTPRRASPYGYRSRDDLYGDDGNNLLFGEGDPDWLISGDDLGSLSGGGAHKCHAGVGSDGFFPC